MNIRYIAPLAAWLTVSCATTSFAAVSAPTQFVDEVVVSGLATPTGFVFLPDGRALASEQKTGKVRLIANGHVVGSAVYTVRNLNGGGSEQGLLSLAVDPGWPARPYVYLFYDRTGAFLRLARYTATGDIANATGENLTLGSEYLILDDLPDNASNHNGGTIRFDDDGYLYLSLGEDADACAAQDPANLKGVVLRLAVGGLPAGAGGPPTRAEITPGDNPFIASTSANARMAWAYGLRNPFRFQIDPVSGKMYLGDVGAGAWEEVDEIVAGDNLGWPHREAFASNSPGCSPPGGFAPKPPITAYDHGEGVAVMCAGAYRPMTAGASNWPTDYWGDVFYADYYSGFLRRLHWNGSAWVAAPAPGQPNTNDWATGLTSPVDFTVGPDGSLYWISQSGGLHRLRYTGAPVGVIPTAPARASLGVESPFADRTSFAFTIARPGTVRLVVYDVRGRAVRHLLDASLGAGANRVQWDGTDDGSRAVASGMYLAVLEHPDGHSLARVLRLR